MSTVKSKKLQVGTDATATNNFTIYQPATPDGTLRIGVGNADSPTEVGQFNANGYKPNLVSAFLVYASTGSTLNQSTTTTIAWDTVNYDLNSDFSLSNNRFIAPIDGIYTFASGIGMSVNDSTRVGVQFIVNQDANKRYWNLVGGASSTVNAQNTITLKLEANDYVQTQAFQDSGNITTGTTNNTNYFTGALLYQI